MNRAAIIIAVQNAGDLPELEAALDGAKAMAKWARAQGFDPVKTITDEKRPVTAEKIRKAIKEIVDSDSYEQLFVYFAGHGVNLHYSEYWLLSEAPENTQAAVNVASSVHLAKRCGIPHVVLVSDACRTAPEGIRAQAIRGSEIFPNQGRGGPQKAVDVFYASLLGEPALEIQDKTASASRYVSIYTEELVAALRGDRRSILTPDAGDASMLYLRPQPLKRHLMTTVPKLVAVKLGTGSEHTQTPDAEILSDEFAYLQKFEAAKLKEPSKKKGIAVTAPAAPPAPTLGDVTAAAIRQALAKKGNAGRAVEDLVTGGAAGAERIAVALVREREAPGPLHYETGCGLKISGAKIRKAFARAGVDAERLSSELVRVSLHAAPAANVLLHLEGGRAVVIPAIADFIAALAFENGELRNVSYEPVDTSWRWDEYHRNREELTALRALIASSVHAGTFRLHSDDALKLTERIRSLKSFDPTMALYAAYSYHRMGKRKLIQEMEKYLELDLHITFFDLVLLADREPGDPFLKKKSPQFPFFPLLAQGWPLLSAFDAWTPRLEALRPHVLNSLWTVFDEKALPILRDALED